MLPAHRPISATFFSSVEDLPGTGIGIAGLSVRCNLVSTGKSDGREEGGDAISSAIAKRRYEIGFKWLRGNGIRHFIMSNERAASNQHDVD